MKIVSFAFMLLAACWANAANVTISPWTPVYKGVDLATGVQEPTQAGEVLQRTSCMRVDLTDPDIELFTTPKCTNCSGFETLAENTGYFLETHRLQVAINCNWYQSSTGPNDVPMFTPEDVTGLAISRGTVVSPSQSTRPAILMFTSNNVPVFIRNDVPPTNTFGMYTAAAGDRALLINGTNQTVPNPSDLDPRTALGISEDQRYLYLMTLDGRQSGWSSGGDWYSTGEWIKRYGASTAINVDGGGSTTMVMADCQGKGIRVNRSSFVAQYGRERVIGHNFGVFARPLPTDIKELDVQPGTTTAIATWRTDLPGTTQVQYGLTTNYGSSTTLDSRLVKKHIATISGLIPGSNYYFRAVSVVNGSEQSAGCQLLTTNIVITTQVIAVTNTWRYSTNNLDGVPWTARNYDDSEWTGAGPGLLFANENNVGVAPRNTVMPWTAGMRTIYFRTPFEYYGPTQNISLLFSNFVDDGAVFYFNGQEMRRLRLPASGPIVNSTAATGGPCPGTAQANEALTTCPDMFTISGNLLTNLYVGTNIFAVEVHNLTTTATSDLVFGTALYAQKSGDLLPRIFLSVEDSTSTFFWNGEGFTLQQSSDLTSPTNWTDVAGPVTQSPYVLNNAPPGNTFYRLRN